MVHPITAKPKGVWSRNLSYRFANFSGVYIRLDLIRLKINAMKLAATFKYGGKTMQVSVRDNNVDQALRALKKKLQREGVYREMKLKQHFEKPSEKKARQAKEGLSRQRKLARKKAEKEG